MQRMSKKILKSSRFGYLKRLRYIYLLTICLFRLEVRRDIRGSSIGCVTFAKGSYNDQHEDTNRRVRARF